MGKIPWRKRLVLLYALFALFRVRRGNWPYVLSSYIISRTKIIGLGDINFFLLLNFVVADVREEASQLPFVHSIFFFCFLSYVQMVNSVNLIFIRFTWNSFFLLFFCVSAVLASSFSSNTKLVICSRFQSKRISWSENTAKRHIELHWYTTQCINWLEHNFFLFTHQNKNGTRNEKKTMIKSDYMINFY